MKCNGYISLDILKKSLQKNDYELFRSFISIESDVENWKFAASQINREEANNSQIEKFKLLLEIDGTGVEQAFRVYEPQETITDRMKQNFEMALDAKRKEKSISLT